MKRLTLALGLAASAAAASPATGAVITSAPPAYTNADPVVVSWTGSTGGDGNFVWSLDNVPQGSGPQTSAAFTGLSEGPHTLVVAEGGVADATATFTVDRTPPTISSSRSPGSPNGDNGWYRTDVTVTWTCTGATSCPASQVLSAQGANAYGGGTISDLAGNTAPIPTGSVNIDKLAPWIQVPNRPSGNIQLGTPALPLVFACDTLDTSGLAYCSSKFQGPSGPRTDFGPSGTMMDYGTPGTRDDTQLGKREYTVDARDGAGNPAPQVRVSYTIVDTIAPTAPVPQSPSDGDVTNEAAPKLSWAASTDTGTGVAKYRVTVDSTSFDASVTTASGAVPDLYTVPLPAGMTLGTGTHTWKVQAIDGAGRASVISSTTFKVDRNAPPAPALSGPTGYTTSRTPTFQAGGLPGATFSWIVERLSGGTYAPVQAGGPAASGVITPAELADGQYRIRVRQRSATGNDGMYAALSFSVDATAPPAPAGLRGPGTTTSIQPSFAWGAPESGATFRWQVLGSAGEVRLGPGATAATSLQLPVALPVGAYTFRLQQVDAAGNVSPASDAAFAIAGPAPAPAPAPSPTWNDGWPAPR